MTAPSGKNGHDDRLKGRLQLMAGLLLVVTVILLADPFRLWPTGPRAEEFLVGMLLTAALFLLGVRGVQWPFGKNGKDRGDGS